MRPRAAITIVVLGMLPPLLAFAQSSSSASSVFHATPPPSAFDRLQQDTKLLRPGLQQHTADEEWEQAQMQREKGIELFPDLTTAPAAAGSSSAERALPSAEPFLTFQENGVTIVLKDVPRQAWFTPYVRSMIEKGVIGGYRDSAGKPLGEFRPGNPVTVEELAKMAVLAAKIDPSTCGESANKSALGRWSAPFIACAERGSWSLFGEASVDVTRPALRAEVVTTALQAFAADTSSVVFSGTGSLSDINSSMSFGSFVEKAVRDGIVSGTGDASGNPTGRFEPMRDINRAETAKILSLATQVYGR